MSHRDIFPDSDTFGRYLILHCYVERCDIWAPVQIDGCFVVMSQMQSLFDKYVNIGRDFYGVFRRGRIIGHCDGNLYYEGLCMADGRWCNYRFQALE